MVDFCYTGNIHLTEENVEKCLKIASSIEIDLLQDKCRQFYATKLTVANSVNTLMVADRYRFVDLRQRAFQLICENFETVPPADIPKLSHQLVQGLLESDKMYEYGDLVAKHLLKWFQSNEVERGVHMPKLLKIVRLEQFTPELLTNTLEPVFKNFKCFDLLVAEYKRRLPGRRENIDNRSSHSIVNVTLQYMGESDAKYSAVKIRTFNNRLNSFGDTDEIPLAQRRYFGAVAYENKIFVMGGSVIGSYLKSVSSYELSSRNEQELPEMNVGRGMFSSIVLGKHIYVIGGNGSRALNSCERFDTENNKWEIMKPMNVARYYTTATIVNGYIYVAGGYVGVGMRSTAVEIYDPNNNEWTQIAPLRKSCALDALIELNGFVYAMGENEDVQRFDPYKNGWTEIGPFDGSRLVTSTIKIDGEIYAIMRNGEFGKIENYGSGKCTFTPLAYLKSKFLQRHFLYSV